MSNNNRKFIDSVEEFAQNVLERCNDKHGDKETPLLMDGIYLKAGEPVKWETHILSNLACQQNFLRTLGGLTMLTGNNTYQERACEWIHHALGVLQDSASGMLYWGGHTSFDLLEDNPLIGNHELKCVYPYYQFLYNVNPEATQFCVEGIWNKHVKNWSNLLFNRHGEYASWDRNAPWAHEYSGGPLPIVDNSMLSFINTGSDLIYAGAQLFSLSGRNEPLLWAKRLTQRYDEIRNETTGLGGYQFNHREPCRVRISFKPPFSERTDVNETTVLKSGIIQTRYGRVAITLLNLFEQLDAADGQDFLDIVSKDLKALGEHAYDFSDYTFSPVLLDGTKLFPDNCMEGVGYCSPRSLEKVPANGLMFLAYAKAYRITKNLLFWKITRGLAQGIGWREIFESADEQTAHLRMDATRIRELSRLPTDSVSGSQNDICTLLGLLELHKATGQAEYLVLAADYGNQLIESCFVDGFFTTGAGTDDIARIDHSLPLALLHLAAVVEGKTVNLPTFYPNATAFDPKVVIARRRRK